jgi:hypothetical protein
MRNLLVLFAIWVLPLAAHAQQTAGAPSSLKAAVASTSARGASHYCDNCAKTDFRGAGPSGVDAGALGVCSQRGFRPGLPSFGIPFVLSRPEPPRFDFHLFEVGRRFQFLPVSEEPSTCLSARMLTSRNSAGAAQTPIARPVFTFFRDGAWLPAGAGSPYVTAAPVQSAGTVNSGTAGNFTFYASTGATVSENTRLKEVSGSTLTYSGAGGLDLTGSSASGQVQLSGATSGTVTLSVKDAAGTYTFKLPDSAGAAGQVLTADGTGQTSWATPTGGSSALAFDTLTSGSFVTWTFSGAERRKAKLTLGANAALSLSGVVPGSEGDLYVKQDATGGRTLTLPANSYVSGGSAGVITLTSSPNAIDKLHFAFDGTNYYWDAPVANYTAAAPARRAAIFNGTNQRATATLPSSAPWNSMTSFQVVFRVRNVDTSVSGRLFSTADGSGGNGLIILAGGGRFDFHDYRDGSVIYHTPADVNDAVVKLQFDQANSRWSMESWKADGTNHVGPNTVALTTTGNYNMSGAFSIAATIFNAMYLSARYDWFYIKPGADAANVFPGAEPAAGSYLSLWKFDDNAGTDSSGNGLNLTLANGPSFENTP